ncbi:UDP-N-acetylglucosamine transporter ROCK1 [Gracilaria domingensis]|nr:UDP-N-acetylglucosamine transporter ROCK1 [Gracilaria domingensis]
MATATPLDGTPSLRSVRDKYLALLLTGNPASNTAPSPQATNWTPGQHLPQAPAVHWASPVTPAPTENDVRLAEIAAGLVAAGNAEKRHTDAIRRLAGELDRSERKVRHLERRRRASSHVPRESGHRVSFGEAKRKIRLSPRAPKYDVPVRRAASEDHRRPSQHFDERDILIQKELDELYSLRRERDDWLKSKERSDKEARRLSVMLADIKRNTQRLLEERHSHLKVISRLQDEVSECKRNAVLTDVDEKIASGRVSNIENVTPPRARGKRDTSPASALRASGTYADMDPLDIRREPEFEQLEREWHGHRSIPSSRGRNFHDVDQVSPSPVLHNRREQELREELRLVIEENGKLTERVSSLEQECTELVKRVRFGPTVYSREDKIRPVFEERCIPENHPSRQSPSMSDAQHDMCRPQVNPEALPRSESERAAAIPPLREEAQRDAPVAYHPQENVEQSSPVSAVPKRASSPSLEEGLVKLLEEVDVLEGVSQAIHFERSPSEAERIQDTLELPELNGDHMSGEVHDGPRPVPVSSNSPRQVLLNTVNRLERIRSSLSLKYGKWLEAVANDETACDETQLSAGSVDAPPKNQEITTGSMNTEVINKLIEN